MATPPSPTPTATTYARSPTPAVLVWDSRTESFSPRNPDPHSSMQFATASSQHHHSIVPSSPSALSTSRRLRHYSNPESVVDFGEFLKQVERERDHSSTSHDQPPTTPPSAMAAASPSSSKPSVKNPLKTALKEVLGGGGNNNGVVSKDAVVFSFGRGGVARTAPKQKTPTLASSTSNPKRDPYYAYVPFGSPPSPISSFFPPNSINPYQRSKSHPQPDPYPSMFGGADSHYFSKPPLPRTTRPSEMSMSQAVEYARQQNRQETAFSPAPTVSSTSSTSEESSDGHHRRRLPALPEALKISTNVEDQRQNRQRSKSFTSPTTPAEGMAPHVGVFLHPEQAAMEAKLAEKKKQEAQNEKKDSKHDDGAVKVVVAPVTSSDHSHQRGREIDVISVDEDDDDALSLGGFPAPPSHVTPPARIISASVPRGRVTGVLSTGPPPRPHTTSGIRPNSRTRLPTMPPPSYSFPPVPSNQGHSVRSIEPTVPRFPPAPSSRPPPKPAVQFAPPNRGGQMLPPHPPPIRRGSAPASASLGGVYPPTLPPIMPIGGLSPDVASLLSSFSSPPPPSSSISEEMILQQQQTAALQREREMLEERVRGLMWLVENLEGQQQGQQPQGVRLARSASSSTVTDKRSSTSTEREVTYLPYAR